jgi:hypothetical protein
LLFLFFIREIQIIKGNFGAICHSRTGENPFVSAVINIGAKIDKNHRIMK